MVSQELDEAVTSLGVRVLRTPVQAPLANSICERLIGTIRWECLGFMIPLSERHLRRILREWIQHYNRGRPHSRLGPGLPEPGPETIPRSAGRHRLRRDEIVRASPILGGLHHEYCLERLAA